MELNRAVAVAMAFGPAAGLELVDPLTSEPSLKGYHLLPSVRGDPLAKLGRFEEARATPTASAPRRKAEGKVDWLKRCHGRTGHVIVKSAIKFINPGSMPPAPGYTHAVEVKNCRLLFISGQVPLDRHGHLVGQGDLAAQTDQVFKNIKVALEAAAASFADVVKLTFYMTDITKIQVVRDMRDLYVNKENPPASSAVEVSRLVNEQFLIEIDAVAAVPL